MGEFSVFISEYDGMGMSSTHEGRETRRTEPWFGVVEKVAELFATAQIEAYARVMFGDWSLRKTSLD
jgi:hypothetical protein